jgi:hypothetical protein
MISCKIFKVEERLDAVHKNNMPVGYYKVGVMHDKPKLGEALYVGSLHTSMLQEIISYDLVKTLNSLYQIEYLDVEGLYVNSEIAENVSEFFLADGLYQVENKLYVVGRSCSEVIPTDHIGWKKMPKKVVEMSQFMKDWTEAYSVLTDLQSYGQYENTVWGKWKDDQIGVRGDFVGYRK